MIQIDFINVGNGNCTVVRIKHKNSKDSNEKLIIIDGGSYMKREVSTSTKPRQLSLTEYLASEKIDYIDTVILTHCHGDHINGLIHALQGRRFGKIYTNMSPKVLLAEEGFDQGALLGQDVATIFESDRTGIDKSLIACQWLFAYANQNNIPIEEVETQVILDVEGHELLMINPSDSKLANMHERIQQYMASGRDNDMAIEISNQLNGVSLITQIKHHGKGLLLQLADVPPDFFEVYGEVICETLESLIVTVPHHGDQAYLSDVCLSWEQMKWLVAQSAIDGPHGNPQQSLIDFVAIKNEAVEVLFTEWDQEQEDNLLRFIIDSNGQRYERTNLETDR